MKKLLVMAMIALGVAGYLMFTGPRMRVQPHVRAWQLAMPPSPAGAVPLEQALPVLPTADQAKSLRQTLSPTAANLAAGRTYYEYYCAFCHGQTGDGHGPVGDSYFPTPTDLRSNRIKSMPDGQLLLAMLSGTGHDPVLRRIVPQKAWWYLLLHVRQL